MPIKGGEALLDGWSVQRAPGSPAPLTTATWILAQFGAIVTEGEQVDTHSVRIIPRFGRPVEAGLRGWTGERALAEAPPQGSVLGAYAALRLAGAAVLAGRRGIDIRLPTAHLIAELSTPLRVQGGSQPVLRRCRDGWVVARWRDEHERLLFDALAADAPAGTRAEVLAGARQARLLVASVERPPAAPAPIALGTGSLGGAVGEPRRRSRVIDWSVLWAGPWAAGQLRRSGSLVQRIEHPRRRDGLLASDDGRRWWGALNHGKRTRLLDARHPRDRRRLENAIRDADVLITSMTPRALSSLGFDDGWRSDHAPHLLHIELVAFEEPWADAPGLGEHAAAQAGLLWQDGAPPAPLHPWADPLLGASALTLSRIWLAGAPRRGGRVRLSLERAASLAFALPV